MHHYATHPDYGSHDDRPSHLSRLTRLVIVISVLGFGWFSGGWNGFLCALIGLGIIGAMIGPPKAAERPVEPPTTWEWEKVDRARRGSDMDATRPDDHPLLLTNTIRRRNG